MNTWQPDSGEARADVRNLARKARNSSPRPLPTSTTVCRPVARASASTTSANSGEACTEVRKWSAGPAVRR